MVRFGGSSWDDLRAEAEGAFVGEQCEFVGEAAAVATEATVGGDDAVTGDKNAEWVPADGVTNGAGGETTGVGDGSAHGWGAGFAAACSDGTGEGAVGGGLAPGDLAELVGDGLTEGGGAGKAVRREWSGEVTGEIAI